MRPVVCAYSYGKVNLIKDEAELEALIERLTNAHESPMPSPWKPDLAGERRTKLLNMIVCFEIEITDVQGKFKLSQNRPAEDRQRVIGALSQSPNPLEAAVAKLMEKEN
ncbi:MAG: FMN-binding negative transcriptional regulator [Polaromonas sp.]